MKSSFWIYSQLRDNLICSCILRKERKKKKEGIGGNDKKGRERGKMQKELSKKSRKEIPLKVTNYEAMSRTSSSVALCYRKVLFLISSPKGTADAGAGRDLRKTSKSSIPWTKISCICVIAGRCSSNLPLKMSPDRDCISFPGGLIQIITSSFQSLTLWF